MDYYKVQWIVDCYDDGDGDCDDDYDYDDCDDELVNLYKVFIWLFIIDRKVFIWLFIISKMANLW